MSYRPFSSTNVDLIKRPHLKVKLTAKQVQEIARCMISPNYFIRQFCQVQHPIKGRVPFKLYDYQERLVATYHEHRHSIALMPRQSGKSSCAAGYLLWYATYVPDSTILITAHKQDGSLEIMSRIRFMYETLPDFIRSGVVSYGRKSIEFDNGSRIIAQATTENTGRGLPVSLLYADEFAFVPPRIAEEFWSSIMPTLSTGGRCIVTSTPNRDDDQFATIWHQANKTTDAYGNETLLGSNGFKAFQAHWSEHPDRGEKWAAAERAKIGEERFRREFETEFITFDETLINSLFLAGMERGDNPCRRSGQVRWYGPLENGPTYLVSLDPSLGTGGDFSAIQVFTLPGMQQLAEWQHNQTIIQNQIKLLKNIVEEIDEAAPDSEIYYSVENNGVGEAAVVSLAEMGEDTIPGIFLSETKIKGRQRKFRRGYTTTHSAKMIACAKFKRWIEEEHMKFYSKNAIRELKNFIAIRNTYEAKEGETDDLIDASLLAVRMAMQIMKYDEQTFMDLKDSFEDEEINYPMPVGIL